MKNNRIPKSILFLILILTGFFSAQNISAQEYTEIYPADTTRMLPDYLNAIVISNPTQNELSVQLSIDKKRWTNAKIGTIETNLFAISKTTDKCFCIIKTSGEKQSKRILYKKHKYKIFWDEKFKKWDIKEI